MVRPLPQHVCLPDAPHPPLLPQERAGAGAGPTLHPCAQQSTWGGSSTQQWVTGDWRLSVSRVLPARLPPSLAAPVPPAPPVEGPASGASIDQQRSLALRAHGARPQGGVSPGAPGGCPSDAKQPSFCQKGPVGTRHSAGECELIGRLRPPPKQGASPSCLAGCFCVRLLAP